MRKLTLSLLVFALCFSLSQKQSEAFVPKNAFSTNKGEVLSESTKRNQNRLENEEEQEHFRFKMSSDSAKPKLETEDENEGSRSGDKKAPKTATRAAELKQQVCDNRKEFANHRLNVVGERVNKLLDHMDEVVSKVEDFYKTKLLPKNVIVTNYDSLLLDISNKNTSLKTAITTVQTNSLNITCTKGEIKTDLQSFKTSVSVLEKAMKDYRDSIQKFVKAIRAAAANYKEKQTATGSATTN